MAMKTYIFLFLLSINFAYSQSALLEKYYKTCGVFRNTGQLDSVIKYAVLTIDLAKKEGQIQYQTRGEFYLGNSLMRTYPDSSIKILNKVEKDLKNQGDLKFLIAVNGAFGNYYGKIGKNIESIKYYLKAREYAEEFYSHNETQNYPKMIAIQHFNIAEAYFEMSDYNLSLENILKAQKIANKHNLKPIELASLIILGNVYLKLGQMELAEKYFLEANTLAINLNDFNLKGLSLSRLGEVYYLKALKNPSDKIIFDKSLKYQNEALKISQSEKDYTSTSVILSSLANLESIRKDYKKANKYLLNALKFADLSKSKLSRLTVLVSLAQNYLETENTKKAIDISNEGLSLSTEIKNEDYTSKLYEILEKSYTKEKDFVKALEFQKAQMTAKDSLYKSSTTSKILELQTKYETEKKQKAIELLTVKNQVNEAQIKQKNYLIIAISALVLSLCGGFFFWFRQRKLKDKQQASDMKQRLLRAQLNPHFLFNCLNSIQRLYVDGKFMQANEFIADFAQLMRDILEKTGRTTIPLYEEMDFIEAYLSLEKRRLGDKFDYEIIMDDDVRNGDFEVPSFIVQPLAENALLHGILPKNLRGKIEVIVDRLKDDSLLITVKDDGVGYYHSLHKAGKHTSKGMELIKSRLGKQGKMLIEELKNLNQEILGTKITLELNM
jgi:tetratricopeptide (TPR) repeat protein